jgi:phosphoribosylformylglycinamidine synthase
MHDVSDGGMAVTLVESLSGSGELGCQIELNSLSKIRHDFLLFGESQSRVIVSCKPEKLTDILMEAKRFAIDAKQIGIVTKKRQLQIGKIIDLSVDEVLNAYNNSIELKMPIEED